MLLSDIDDTMLNRIWLSMSVDLLGFPALCDLYKFAFSKRTFLRHVYPRLPVSRYAVSMKIKNMSIRAKVSAKCSPYSLLRAMYPKHYSAYRHMFDHAKQLGLEIDTSFVPRGALGFSQFIDYMGDIPEHIDNPHRGRIDHSIGYIKGNFVWQDRDANLAEMRSRTDYSHLWSNQARAHKNRKLLCVLTTNEGSCILLSFIEPVVNYSTKKRLLLSLREYGCVCLPIGGGEYTVTIPNFSNHTC